MCRDKMMCLSGLVLGLTLGILSSASAGTYTITTIDVPGADQTQAFGINNSGQIVGLFSDLTGFHGFLKDGDVFVTIDLPPGGSTQALGINGLGQIVGTNGVDGFLKAGATVTDVIVPGAFFTTAWGINDGGQIVGAFGQGTVTHGFLLSGNTFTPIDGPGASFTEATGINDSGQIVGNFVDAAGFHGYSLKNGALTLVQVPGATVTEVHGIDSSGHIVGSSVDSAGVTHGFVSDGPAFAAVDVPGAIAPFTQAKGMNDRGQVVGWFQDASGTHGFLATPASLLVPFAAFTAEVEIGDEFELKANFTLGPGSNGIDPLTEDVTLQVGTFSTRIPAGSFKSDENGSFQFEGVVAGVTLEVEIQALGGGRFELSAEGEGANLGGIVNPVEVRLVIRDDGGSATVMAELDQGDR